MLGRSSALLRAARPMRLLSTAAMPMEPPIAMFGIAGRYATALYAAAAKKSELLDVEADFKLFKQTVDASPPLKHFVVDPSMSRTQKVAGMTSVMDAANASVSTKNAMLALAEGGRMADVFKVIDLYGELLTAAKGEVKAVVTSAKPLPAAELATIKEDLTKLLGEGQKSFSLETKVDPALISGHTIEFGDKFMDLSVATQLKKLQALLFDGI